MNAVMGGKDVMLHLKGSRKGHEAKSAGEIGFIEVKLDHVQIEELF